MGFSDAIRNFGIIAHVDAGKTTLTEQILHETGALRVCGAVEDGNTVSDYLLQERQRGISIVSAAVTCRWHGLQYNLVDTPGHIDFTAEVERSLRVMDAAVAVYCGLRGVQAQSEMVWRRARRYGLPALAFVNKLDRDGACFEAVLEQLKALFAPAVPLVVSEPVYASGGARLPAGVVDLLDGGFDPLGGRVSAVADGVMDGLDDQRLLGRELLFEQLAGVDDELMDRYLSGHTGQGVAASELSAAIRRCVLKGTVVPVLCGSANAGLGIGFLLDAIGAFLPSPSERLASAAGKRCVNLPSSLLRRDGGGAYLSATVIKVMRSEWPGDCAAVRLYSGVLRPGARLADSRGRQFSVGKIWRLNAADLEPIGEASAGDIVGVSTSDGERLPVLVTGDTLLEDGCPRFRLARMNFPEPVISTVLSCADPADQPRLVNALHEMAEADPTLRLRRDRESGRPRLWGLGELHLEIVRDRLKSEYGLVVNASRPAVAYRSTVQKKARVNYEFVRQIAGLAQLQAQIEIEFDPLPRGSGNQVCLPYREHTALPKGLQDAIESAMAEVVEAGSPSGFPLTDTRVTILAGSTTMAEPSEPAFLTAVKLAAGEAFAQAGETVLEPVTRLEVDAPPGLAGAVIADLNARSARVCDVVAEVMGCTRIVALVPLSELFSYATQLRSLTGGKAGFTAEQHGYEVRHAPGQKTR